jgi:hypothetical protein
MLRGPCTNKPVLPGAMSVIVAIGKGAFTGVLSPPETET